jgi:RNA polymerase sigma-70 factor (ECF subfamily)
MTAVLFKLALPPALHAPKPADEASEDTGKGTGEDTALMRRIAAHDAQALETFYRASIRRVFGMALRITRNRAIAEEVAEDVYVQLWQRAAAFDPQRGSSLGWTLTICRSRALDALRRADPAILDAEPTERPDALLESGGNPRDLVEATRRHRALHAAIERLQPLQRQLLSLAFFGELSHSELARHTGLPLGTVKSTIRRSLAALRDELDRA